MAKKRIRKKKKFTYHMQKNLFFCYCVVLLGLVGLIGVIVKINVKDGDRYKKKVLNNQTYTSAVIPFRRGDIIDRNGTVMATSIKEYKLALDPAFILSKNEKTGEYIYKDSTIDALCGFFDFDRDDLEKTIEENSVMRYYVYKNSVSSEEKEKYNEYLKDYLEKNEGASVKGVTFEENYVRKYPLGKTASTVIGFTYDKNAGNWGIEGYYNSQLNGTDGKEFGYFDSELALEPTVINATNGNNIVSTIDVNIQRIVEENIEKFEKEMGGKTVAVMMTDPQSGEILAMASNRGMYDLSDPRNISEYWTQEDIKERAYKNLIAKAKKDEIYEEGKDSPGDYYDEQEINDAIKEAQNECRNEMWRNFCVSDTYEPGSTYKPFVIATGLEENILKGNETYTCNGSLVVGGRPIRCANRNGHGTITLEQGLNYSCNVVLMSVAEQMGKQTFLNYQNQFGFGAKTGVDIQGEASGLIFTEEQVKSQELATSSFGQGINVTMTQMVAAFGSLINGGNYYEPHVVKQILNDKGAVVENIDKTLVKQTVSASTSATLRKYLYSTVESGTGSTAAVKGYTIGGKTGTAEKLPRGQENYLVSFLGFAAVDDEAKAICYVIVDEPHTESQAHSTYAQQVFSDIMADALPFLGVYPNSDEHADYYGQGEDENTPDDNDTDNNKSDGESDDDDSQKTDSLGNPVKPAVPFTSEDDYDYEAIGSDDDVTGDESDDNTQDTNEGDGNDEDDDGNGNNG